MIRQPAAKIKTTPRPPGLRLLPRVITMGLGVWMACGIALAASGPASNISRLYDAGEYTKVTSLMAQTLARDPHNTQANLWMVRCYIELGDFDLAIRYARQAVALEPNSSQAHLWLGRAYGSKAESAKSFVLARYVRREFEKAVQLNPDDLSARRDLMEFYLEAPWVLGGSRDKAWQQAQAIAARDAGEGHLARAAIWKEVDQPAKAEAEYRQLLDSKPREIDPYFEMADYYEMRRDPANIERVTEAAASLDPNDPRLGYYRGVARVVRGRDLPDAERLLFGYLSRTPNRSDYPSHASAYVWLGQAYEMEGKAQEAARQFRAALRLDPGRIEARQGLGRLQLDP
jgi:tetratricopeptide (TPR) repeat protein